MKRRIFGLVFAVVCWLCSPKSASAQLDSYCFAAHYSSYISRNIGSDHNSIVQTVQVSGYTEAKNPAVWMGPQLGWQYPCSNLTSQMQSATHTSSIRNVLGSTGGNYSQGPTPAFSYNNYSIAITAPVTPGTIYSSETNAQVTCPVAGGIFSGTGNWQVEIAYTRAIDTYVRKNCVVGKISTTCDMVVKPWCSYTTPPDWPVSTISSMVYPIGPPPFWDAFTVCFRFTNLPLGWICAPNGVAVERLDPNLPLAYCTSNP